MGKVVHLFIIGNQNRSVLIGTQCGEHSIYVLNLTGLLDIHFLIERLYLFCGQGIVIDTCDGNIALERIAACGNGVRLKINAHTYETLLSVCIGQREVAAYTIDSRSQFTVGIKLVFAGLLVPNAHKMNPFAIYHRAESGILIASSDYALEVPFASIDDDTEAATLITSEDIAPGLVELTILKAGTGHYLHCHTILDGTDKLVIVRDANRMERLLTPLSFLIAKHIHAIHGALLDVWVTQYTHRVGHCRRIYDRTVIIEDDIQHVGFGSLRHCCQSHSECQGC